MRVHDLCLWLYAGLLWLYPREFRAEFEAEMMTAFTSMLREERMRGGFGFILACLRELRDIPFSALSLRLSHRRKRQSAALNPRQPSGTINVLRSGTIGYGSTFALISLVQTLGGHWLIQQGTSTMHYTLRLYYGFCGGCGAAAAVVLGLALGRQGKRARLILVGFLSFSWGALAANRWLPPITHSGILAATASLSIQLILMAALTGLFFRGAVRDWRLLVRFTTTGTMTLAGGSLLGYAVAMLLWALAQAVASYQAAPVYAWVIQNIPLALTGIAPAVAGAIWAVMLIKIKVAANRHGPGLDSASA